MLSLLLATLILLGLGTQAFAQERGEGLRLTSGVGLLLAPRDAEPLVAREASVSVEAAWSAPIGSSAFYEIGLRGVVRDRARPGEAGGNPARGHELSMVAAVRAHLLPRPGELGLMPYFRGGVRVGAARDSITAITSTIFGPHLGAGLERSLGAGAFGALELAGYTTIEASVRIVAELRLVLLAEAF